MKSLLTILASLIFTALASAQTPQDPVIITSAPYTINAAGYYRLGNNLSYAATSGSIITINASNVTLDLNGFYIAGPNNPGQTVNGISASNRSNLNIVNGTVAFCYVGVNLSGGSNSVNTRITGLRITNCYSAGIQDISPVGHLIADNQVATIGGTTTAGSAAAFGIRVVEGSVVIRGNQVSGVTGVGAGTGTGIYCSNSNSHFVLRNQVNNCATGVRMNAAQGNKYQDNLTASCTTPFDGGVDAGGNN